MIKLVKDLVDYQSKCVALAGGQGLHACPTGNVKNFLLNHNQFDGLLKDFPTGLVLMFPDSRPHISTTEDGSEPSSEIWPDDPTLEEYRKGIAAHASAFREARYIVLVGRASRGTAAANYGYAQSRVRFARNRLLDALADKTVARGEVSRKFIEFALGSERPLQLEFFSRMYKQPAVWWDPNAQRELSDTLKKLTSNSVITTVERDRAEAAVNRSVAIFAIPPECVKE